MPANHPTAVSRRSALRAGLIVTIAAGLAGTVQPPPPVPAPMDRSDALLGELEALLPHLGYADLAALAVELQRLWFVAKDLDPAAASAAWPRWTGADCRQLRVP